MHRNSIRRLSALTMVLVTTAATSVAWPGDTEAGRNVRNTTKTNVNRNVNQNRNTNVNRNRNTNINQNRNVNVNRDRNVNIDRDVDIDVDVDRGWGGPSLGAVAAGAAVATATAVVTSAVIGSMVNTLPPACSVVVVNGVTFQQCGSAWYQPQYVGTQVSYVVVNPPR